MPTLASTIAYADAELGTITVTGTKTSQAAASNVTPADATAFVTIIDTAQSSPHATSVADLLEQKAGVQLRSRGGLGAFTSVSIRGSDAQEVAVYVDGVPISRAGAGLIDLSQMPIEGVERIEIYRGAPPIEFGGEAVGGVIHIITRKGSRKPVTHAQAGGGSFGARSASLWHTRTDGQLKIAAAAAYEGATGNFPYYDYAGTLFNTADDTTRVRQNNGFDQGSANFSLERPFAQHWTWTANTQGFLRWQGVPGPGSLGAATTTAQLATSRMVSEASIRGHLDKIDVDTRVFATLERVAFTNLAADKVGPFGASVTDAVAFTGGTFVRVRRQFGEHQLLSLFFDGRVERRFPSDLLHTQNSGASSTRGLFGLAAGDEVRFFSDRLVFEPALRFDAMTARIYEGGQSEQPSDSVFVSPRLVVRGRVGGGVTLRASVGRYVRFPTLLEQFGDGAFLLATGTLRPESAWGGDIGATHEWHHGRFVLHSEGAFFARRVQDFIAIVNLGNALGAVNIADTTTLGAEARLQASFGPWVNLRADYTYLHAVNNASLLGGVGDELPNRPANQFSARLEGGWPWLRASYDVSFVDKLYRDTLNYNIVPGYWLSGIGLSTEKKWFRFAVEIRNLFDLRTVELPLGGTLRGEKVPYPLVDFFDYPLPGRAVYATLTFQTQ